MSLDLFSMYIQSTFPLILTKINIFVVLEIAHTKILICPQYYSYGLAYATHEIDGISSLKLKHHTTIEYYVTTPHSNVYMSIYIRQITCTSFHPYMCLYFLHLCSYPICNQSTQPYYRTISPNGCFPVFQFLLGREFSPPS